MSEEVSRQLVRYHKIRQMALCVISGSNSPECSKDNCTEQENLHVHHVEPMNGEAQGGRKRLKALQQQVKDGEELEVLCEKHHVEEHARRDDLTSLERFAGGAV